jgi:hypothetical protein
MKRHGKTHMPVDCLVRLDVQDPDDFRRVSSKGLHKVLAANIQLMFGAAAPIPAVLLADFATRTIRFTLPRSGVEKLRAACVLVHQCDGVNVSATVTAVLRHKPKRRAPRAAQHTSAGKKLKKKT